MNAPGAAFGGGAAGGAGIGAGGGVGIAADGGGVIDDASAGAAPNICVNAPGAALGTGVGAATGTGVVGADGLLGDVGSGVIGAAVGASEKPNDIMLEATGGAVGVVCRATGSCGTGPLVAFAASQFDSGPMPAMNSVTIANPLGSVAVSSTRLRAVDESAAKPPRSWSTSSGPALSATCTSTTRPVAISCALCDRMDPSTAMHLSRRYLALKSSLIGWLWSEDAGQGRRAVTREIMPPKLTR